MKTRFFSRQLRSAVARSLNLRHRAVWAAALILALVVTATLTLRPGLLTGAASAGATSPADKQTRARVADNFGKLPLYFVENRGQLDKRVGYYVQGSDKTIYFTNQGLTFLLNGKPEARPETPNADNPRSAIHDQQSERWALKLDFVGARAGVRPEGQEQTGATFSYFRGSRSEWQAGLKSYSRIVYRDLWPGIDLVYAGTVNRMKYTFVVKPGADPNQIKLAWRGASAVKLNDAGELEVKTPVSGFTDERPVSWQEVDGRKVEVASKYQLEKGQSAIRNPQSAIGYGFQVGEYDRSRELVIDPAVLVYCGFIGGTGSDRGNGIAVDSAGNAYVTGRTSSTEATFPETVGPDLTHNGGNDAFVAKVNASGTALVYCGYIGGSGTDQGNGIAVDGAGNAYVTGSTASTEATFPVTVGPDLTHNGGNDAFVAKVNASGTALDYCGYIGGSSSDSGIGIAVDSAGNAYVTGLTASTETSFPVTVGPDLTHNGGNDAFVAKVNASGTALVYCGYIGGSGGDSGNGIAVDSAGNAYVTGDTGSTETSFPVTVGPDLTANGGFNAYVAKVNASGAALDYCGYIDGNGTDNSAGIAVDSAGNAYVTGRTSSTETSFPVTVGPDLTYNGGSFDVFVAKVNASGTALVYCGYIGGSDSDVGNGIAVDGAGNAYVTGSTASTEATFPVTVGPDLTYNGGFGDAFVAKVNASGTALVYAGYIGGSGFDDARGIAVDSAGNAYVTGFAASTETSFPVTVGPDLTHNGGDDAFVAKISTNTAPTIAAMGLTRTQGTSGNSQIASVLDAEDAENTLTVTATPLTGSGVTISNIAVDGSGNVTADVSADCSATSSTFTLEVKDSQNATTTDTLTVTVNLNPAPTLSYANQSVIAGNSLTVNPATGPSDNGSVASVVVQSVAPPLTTAPTVNSSGVVTISVANPAGLHTITIRATDDCGKTTDASFTLDVKTAQQATAAITAQVNALVPGTLTSQKANTLTNKLDAAIKQLDKGNTNAACTQLQDFIDLVNNYIGNGTLTSAQGQPLINAATSIRAALGCS